MARIGATSRRSASIARPSLVLRNQLTVADADMADQGGRLGATERHTDALLHIIALSLIDLVEYAETEGA